VTIKLYIYIYIYHVSEASRMWTRKLIFHQHNKTTSCNKETTNNKIEKANYITLINNNGSDAGMVGDSGGLVSVGSGMVGFAHDADGDQERGATTRERERWPRSRWEGEVASMIMREEGGKLSEKGRRRVW